MSKANTAHATPLEHAVHILSLPSGTLGVISVILIIAVCLNDGIVAARVSNNGSEELPAVFFGVAPCLWSMNKPDTA